jgi:hypothetical protein
VAVRWKVRATRRAAGRRRFTGEPIAQPQRKRGSHGESPELSPGGGFYLAASSDHRRRESQRRRRESQRRLVVGGEGLPCCRSDLSEALYHGELGSDSLTEQFAGEFSSNFMWQQAQVSAPKL